MTPEKLYFNGINGATGQYMTPPLTPEQVSKIAQGVPLDEDEANELKSWYRFRSVAPFPVKEGVNPDDLAQSGWGIIFASDDAERVPELIDALNELLTLRQEQAGELYREFTGPDAYRPGESKRAFLERHNVGPGPVDPTVVPYYLLIIGDPETIPYHIQYQLDVQYSVGRISFDAAEQYAQYARSVVAAERGDLRLPRQATFFGVQNPGDPATRLGATELVKPLAERIASEQSSWEVNTLLAEEATKAQLAHLLGGEQTPALLFTESHGMAFPLGDTRLLQHTGALLCQDWPGPNAWGRPIEEDHYFSGDDVGQDADLLGMMAFFFACFGAGSPHRDDFSFDPNQLPPEIAPNAFLSRLPQKLIGHPRGGALAVVGHVERAWGYSFMWGGAGRQLEVFNSTLQALMNRRPIGAALEHFNLRYAELATDVTDTLNNIRHGATADDYEVAGLWTAHNDARSYILLGDPAVRLPVADGDEDIRERVAIQPVTLAPRPSTDAQAETREIAPESDPVTTEVTAFVTADGTVVPMSPATVDRAMVDFGAMQDVRAGLQNSIKLFADRLGTALQEAVSDASELEVATYVSDDMTKAAANKDAPGTLRALTRIKIDGDTTVCVPERQGEIYDELWTIHLDSVKQAQDNRAEMLKTAVAAATSLLEALKVV